MLSFSSFVKAHLLGQHQWWIVYSYMSSFSYLSSSFASLPRPTPIAVRVFKSLLFPMSLNPRITPFSFLSFHVAVLMTPDDINTFHRPCSGPVAPCPPRKTKPNLAPQGSAFREISISPFLKDGALWSFAEVCPWQ
jgi:hypothetical protein